MPSYQAAICASRSTPGWEYVLSTMLLFSLLGCSSGAYGAGGLERHRWSALNRMSDQGQLAEVALNDESERLRPDALKRPSDPEVL
jgi:hypothetical protein